MASVASAQNTIRQMNRVSRLIPLFVFIFALSGCAYPISRAVRDRVNADLTLSQVRENPQSHVGENILWGGKIIETVNEPDHTEIVILAMPLDAQGWPKGETASEGRFIARTDDFLDPAIYEKGIKITLAGEITGAETRPLGNRQYLYPIIKITDLFIWQEEIYPSPGPFWYYPWNDPWDDLWHEPWFGPWHYNYWYSPSPWHHRP